MGNKKKRVFLLGIDGLPPETFKRFLQEGVMPNFESILEDGVEVKMLPTLPPLTAPGWMTIASGASPESLGIFGILQPEFGTQPNNIANGFDQRRSQVKYVWETLADSGFNSIVLKYPGTWPPKSNPGVIQIDGAGGYADISCENAPLKSHAYISETASVDPAGETGIFPQGYMERWRIDTGSTDGMSAIVTRPANGWTSLRQNIQEKFEFVLHVGQGKSHQVFHGLAFMDRNTPQVLLARTKSAETALILREGEWSDWCDGTDGERAFMFRFKLLSLSIKNRHIHIYCTEGHATENFTEPKEWSQELVRNIGPVEEWTGTYDFMNGLIDADTQDELYKRHSGWLERCIDYMCSHTDWDCAFMQWHVLEYAHHLYGVSIHADHPEHHAGRAKTDIAYVRSVYRQADELLATVLRQLDDESLLLVVSDHGHDLVHTIFFINHFLLKNKWLSLYQDGDEITIDWNRTKAYGVFPGAIYINRKTQWEHGILDDKEANALCATIKDAFYALRYGKGDKCPIEEVLGQSEMAEYGVAGGEAPDLIVCLKRGYETATRISASENHTHLFEPAHPYEEVSSGHGSFHPKSDSAATLAIVYQPGKKLGAVDDAEASLFDIAPTITNYLGVKQPKHSEGISLFKTTLEGR